MRLPAKQARRPRTVIQWSDDGAAARMPQFLSDDAPPYRALGLAAILGIVSIVAVVAAIQFQRQGEFPEVGPLVETAHASAGEASSQTSPADIAPQPAPVTADTAAKPSVTAPAAPTTPSIETPAVAVAAEQRSEPRKTTAAKPVLAARAVAPSVASANAPLTTSARWAPDAKPTPAAPAPTEKARAAAGELLALAAEEAPTAMPQPIAAPRQDETKVAAVDTKPKRAVEKAAAQAEGGAANAKVRSSVFLRARPADGAQVLVTVPGGASVQVASNCRHWCAVTYNGKTGYIYKSFLRR